MPVKELITPLRPGFYYHVYNRGNNRDKLFYFQGDYKFFMKKYHEYLGEYLTTYGYCLLPNHFHFLISINENLDEKCQIVSNQFRKLFISYARRINLREARSGGLLTKNFRRVEVSDDDYLRRLLMYIHYNPVKHGIIDSFFDYPYSSFKPILSNQLTGIQSQQIFEWYGGQEAYLEYHHLIEGDKKITNLLRED